MVHKKAKKETRNATRASIQKEMAKPRMARSARITELNLDTARTPEQPSTTMPGTVDRIIPSRRPTQPETAQIAVDRTDHRYRGLRIENTLTDEHGDDVKLEKGARVQVTSQPNPRHKPPFTMQAPSHAHGACAGSQVGGGRCSPSPSTSPGGKEPVFRNPKSMSLLGVGLLVGLAVLKLPKARASI